MLTNLYLARVCYTSNLLHQPHAARVQVPWATALVVELTLLVERGICPPVFSFEVQLDDGHLQQHSSGRAQTARFQDSVQYASTVAQAHAGPGVHHGRMHAATQQPAVATDPLCTRNASTALLHLNPNHLPHLKDTVVRPS